MFYLQPFLLMALLPARLPGQHNPRPFPHPLLATFWECQPSQHRSNNAFSPAFKAAIQTIPPLLGFPGRNRILLCEKLPWCRDSFWYTIRQSYLRGYKIESLIDKNRLLKRHDLVNQSKTHNEGQRKHMGRFITPRGSVQAGKKDCMIWIFCFSSFICPLSAPVLLPRKFRHWWCGYKNQIWKWAKRLSA